MIRLINAVLPLRGTEMDKNGIEELGLDSSRSNALSRMQQMGRQSISNYLPARGAHKEDVEPLRAAKRNRRPLDDLEHRYKRKERKKNGKGAA